MGAQFKMDKQQLRGAVQKALGPASLWWFCQLNAGIFLTALGVHFFKTPNHFAIGGTTGISIVLAAVFPKGNVGGFLFLINTVLVVLGLIFLGVRQMGGTIYSSYALSFFVALCEKIYPMPAPFTDDTLLELAFGVLLPAIGSAIVFNLGASTGGTDILAMILAKHTSLEIGRALMVSDIVIVVAGGFCFGMSTFLYCILGLFARTFMVDGMIENINMRKQVTIVTAHPEALRTFILDNLHRGATVHTAYGAFTHREIEELTTVLTRHETVLLRNYIRKVDPKAFITIVNSSEVIGKGFRSV